MSLRRLACQLRTGVLATTQSRVSLVRILWCLDSAQLRLRHRGNFNPVLIIRAHLACKIAVWWCEPKHVAIIASYSFVK